eukprot:COSAG01_NODE_623_length_14742_cov_22.391177_16_plen_90_part_00
MPAGSVSSTCFWPVSVSGTLISYAPWVPVLRMTVYAPGTAASVPAASVKPSARTSTLTIAVSHLRAWLHLRRIVISLHEPVTVGTGMPE